MTERFITREGWQFAIRLGPGGWYWHGMELLTAKVESDYYTTPEEAEYGVVLWWDTYGAALYEWNKSRRKAAAQRPGVSAVP